MIGSPILRTKREWLGARTAGAGRSGQEYGWGSREESAICRYCLRSTERMRVPVDATSALR
jgi:hypothetical protein